MPFAFPIQATLIDSVPFFSLQSNSILLVNKPDHFDLIYQSLFFVRGAFSEYLHAAPLKKDEEAGGVVTNLG